MTGKEEALNSSYLQGKGLLMAINTPTRKAKSMKSKELTVTPPPSLMRRKKKSGEYGYRGLKTVSGY